MLDTRTEAGLDLRSVVRSPRGDPTSRLRVGGRIDLEDPGTLLLKVMLQSFAH
jgi:hypothetical protein